MIYCIWNYSEQSGVAKLVNSVMIALIAADAGACAALTAVMAAISAVVRGVRAEAPRSLT